MSDLISRADAIEAIRKCKFNSDMPSYWYRGMEDALHIVETRISADAVEVDRTSEWVAVRREEYEDLIADAVHGEWVCKEREYNDCDGHYAHYWYECSVCGARPPKNEWKNEWHSNFCPSCGARMKGGDDE